MTASIEGFKEALTTAVYDGIKTVLSTEDGAENASAVDNNAMGADGSSSVVGNDTAGSLLSRAPAFSQFNRILHGLATVIVKQTSEVDIPDRRISTFVSYLTSPFALLCMLMAVVLNRTVVFASVRRPQVLPPSMRLLIRSVAIFQLARATSPLLTALKCYSPLIGPYIPNFFSLAPSQKCPGPDILWYLYKAFCVGHFVETFSSALQGRIPSPDTGMTLFEYSLAFQEAQSTERPSVEILVISLIWSLNYMTFLIISVLDLQNYRLIPSSLFGLTSLSYFAYCTFNGRAQYFPTVWVIGFAPHLAVLYVIIMCGTIYLLASLFAGGTANLQSSVRTINVSLSEDFYSCLLKIGVLVLTSAADATYMSEAPSLVIPDRTWIESLDNTSRTGFEYINGNPSEEVGPSNGLRRRRIAFRVESNSDFSPEFGNSMVRYSRRSRGRGALKHLHQDASLDNSLISGYASHNTKVGGSSNLTGGMSGNRKPGRIRRLMLVNRITMAYTLVRSSCRFAICLIAKLLGNIKNRLWKQISGRTPQNSADTESSNAVLVYADDRGNIEPESNDLNQLSASSFLTDEDYYALFLGDSIMPEDDPSADFVPSDEDEDGTTIEADEQADDDDDSNINGAILVSGSSVLSNNTSSFVSELYPELGMSDISLSSLLLPRTSEERHLARLMTVHLSSSEIVTRGKLKYYEDQLYGPDSYAYDSDSDGYYDDESAILVSVINDRRQSSAKDPSVINDTDDGVGANYHSLLCVVCHSSQRNIVLWPCRCLAVCEECRVSLALRNFKGCVCCRRDVVSFSRLYVP
ncbi:hypothetical protein V1511DRAFT_498952 [Dipodascopsis uninucleata]